MDELRAITSQAIDLLVRGGAPLWAIVALAVVAAVVLVVGPKIRLPKVKVEPSPVVDEGGEQQPGTSLEQGADGGFILPTDPNREDLNSGGG